MAFVLPILASLSFGVADYGYFFYLKSTLQGAAQSGARAAISSAATNASVNGTNGMVTNVMTAAGIPASNYTVTLNPSNISGLSVGTPITVTVTAVWGTVGTHALPASLGGISNAKQIVGIAVMQKEANP
jgi:Flp pilus assembly protein TadG